MSWRLELLSVELGSRLCLYERLAALGSVTAEQLADGAGISERYAREWLEQQTVAGVVEVDDPSFEPLARRFTLLDGHAHVLLDRDSEAYVGPVAAFVRLSANLLDRVAGAFRSGGGVPYGAYGIHDIQAAWTRPAFLHHLTHTWLPAVPDTTRSCDRRRRVCEIGCGEGIAAIQIALSFPGVTVDDYDLDDASIAQARKHDAEAGVADRLRFDVRDSPPLESAAPTTWCSASRCCRPSGDPPRHAHVAFPRRRRRGRRRTGG